MDIKSAAAPTEIPFSREALRGRYQLLRAQRHEMVKYGMFEEHTILDTTEHRTSLEFSTRTVARRDTRTSHFACCLGAVCSSCLGAKQNTQNLD